VEDSVQEREREIFDLVEPAVASQGLDLVEVSLGGGTRRPVVRVVVHSAAGVTHADCVRATRAMGRVLDEANALPGSYLLEVSSPGTDRVLRTPREFDVFRGCAVRVQLADGTKEIDGRAAGSRGDAIAVARENGEEDILPWSRIGRARLVPEPPDSKGGRRG
jgi:ribosome maturation factor RimP